MVMLHVPRSLHSGWLETPDLAEKRLPWHGMRRCDALAIFLYRLLAARCRHSLRYLSVAIELDVASLAPVITLVESRELNRWTIALGALISRKVALSEDGDFCNCGVVRNIVRHR